MKLKNRIAQDDRLPRYSGFTLIELLATIGIAGILLAIAIPNFTTIITSNGLTTNTNEFVSALNFARSEAINRGAQVTVKSISATNGQWDGGWNIFVDQRKADGTVGADGLFNDDGDTNLCEPPTATFAEDCLVRTHEALPNGYSLKVGATTAFKNSIAYTSSGLSTVIATPATDAFVLCKSSGTMQRTITIAATGRPSITETTGSCQ